MSARWTLTYTGPGTTTIATLRVTTPPAPANSALPHDKAQHLRRRRRRRGRSIGDHRCRSSSTEIDQQGETDQVCRYSADAGDEDARDVDLQGDQNLDIDQRIEVDVEVSEDDGVIVVEIDVDIEDDLESESDLDADLHDADEAEFDLDLDQDEESDSNIDTDVEIRDDLDADIDVDIAALIDTAMRGAASLAETDDEEELGIDLDDAAEVAGEVDIVVDLTPLDA